MPDTLQPVEMQDTRALHESIVSSALEFERAFRRNRPTIWWSTLVGPFALTLGILLFVGFEWGLGTATRLVFLELATFFGFGRFVIMMPTQTGADALIFIEQGWRFVMVTYMDIMVAVLLAFHIGFMFKLPVIGPKIGELVADGQFILRSQPWMKRLTVVGLVAFIMFPVAATGSVGGSIFGRLLGMGRAATVGWIALGSLLANLIMYWFGDLLRDVLPEDSMIVQYGGIVVILVLVFLLERRYRKMKNMMLATPPGDSSLDPERTAA